MFSLAFLEIKSLTKISNTKTKKDWNLGCTIILAVFFNYLLIVGVFMIGFLVGGDENQTKQQMMSYTYNAFMTMPDPFQKQERTFNFFDLTYIITFVMMYAQAVVMLQVARENLFVFVQEHENQKLSKLLDWKNRGIDTKNKQRRAAAGAGKDD